MYLLFGFCLPVTLLAVFHSFGNESCAEAAEILLWLLVGWLLTIIIEQKENILVMIIRSQHFRISYFEWEK